MKSHLRMSADEFRHGGYYSTNVNKFNIKLNDFLKKYVVQIRTPSGRTQDSLRILQK
jgi:hypothetical protein